MQSLQVKNVGLPLCGDPKRELPAWTQDPKIFPLAWYSTSRANIIQQTKEYVSELSKWRNCKDVKTLSKLKAVLKKIMMFLHTHIAYIDSKSLLECDLEEDLKTLVSLYADMELRVRNIRKMQATGETAKPETEAHSARVDKMLSDRISYWMYTVLTGHDQRADALLSTTVLTRHTRPVLDPIFRKVLSEMPEGPYSNVNYVRHVLVYRTWRERTLVVDDAASKELNSQVLQRLVPRDYEFPSPLLRCIGKGSNVMDHIRPRNVNLVDACRNFTRYCREMPAVAAEQINFESIPLLDDDMLGDEEYEINNLMNIITNRKKSKPGYLSPRSNFQIDGFIDLTLGSPKSRTIADVTDFIDLTEEDEKPLLPSITSVSVEPSATTELPVSTPPRTLELPTTPNRTPAEPQLVTSPRIQQVNTSKTVQIQPPEECSHALTPISSQVETRCYKKYRDQDIFFVNISCMCPFRTHTCQSQDKKSNYLKESKPLKTSSTERKCEKDTFVGGCFQVSIGNQCSHNSDVEKSPERVKSEMKPSTSTTTCNTKEVQDEASQFCDNLFSGNLNRCDCEACKKRDTNFSNLENRTCRSAGVCDESASSDNSRIDSLINCSLMQATSVADMYAMEKAAPIILQSQPSYNENSETLDKRKIQCSENQIPLDTLRNESSNTNNNETDSSFKCVSVFPLSTNIFTSEDDCEENVENEPRTDKSDSESTNNVITIEENLETLQISDASKNFTENTEVKSTIISKAYTQSETKFDSESTNNIIPTEQNLEILQISDVNKDSAENIVDNTTVSDTNIQSETDHRIEIEKLQISDVNKDFETTDCRTEIEKLCSEITDLSDSLSDVDNQEENQNNIEDSVQENSDNVERTSIIPYTEILQNNLSEETYFTKEIIPEIAVEKGLETISENTEPSFQTKEIRKECSKRNLKTVFENIKPAIKDVSIREENLEAVSNNTELNFQKEEFCVEYSETNLETVSENTELTPLEEKMERNLEAIPDLQRDEIHEDYLDRNLEIVSTNMELTHGREEIREECERNLEAVENVKPTLQQEEIFEKYSEKNFEVTSKSIEPSLQKKQYSERNMEIVTEDMDLTIQEEICDEIETNLETSQNMELTLLKEDTHRESAKNSEAEFENMGSTFLEETYEDYSHLPINQFHNNENIVDLIEQSDISNNTSEEIIIDDTKNSISDHSCPSEQVNLLVSATPDIDLTIESEVVVESMTEISEKHIEIVPEPICEVLVKESEVSLPEKCETLTDSICDVLEKSKILNKESETLAEVNCEASRKESEISTVEITNKELEILAEPVYEVSSDDSGILSIEIPNQETETVAEPICEVSDKKSEILPIAVSNQEIESTANPICEVSETVPIEISEKEPKSLAHPICVIPRKKSKTSNKMFHTSAKPICKVLDAKSKILPIEILNENSETAQPIFKVSKEKSETSNKELETLTKPICEVLGRKSEISSEETVTELESEVLDQTSVYEMLEKSSKMSVNTELPVTVVDTETQNSDAVSVEAKDLTTRKIESNINLRKRRPSVSVNISPKKVSVDMKNDDEVIPRKRRRRKIKEQINEEQTNNEPEEQIKVTISQENGDNISIVIVSESRRHNPESRELPPITVERKTSPNENNSKNKICLPAESKVNCVQNNINNQEKFEIPSDTKVLKGKRRRKQNLKHVRKEIEEKEEELKEKAIKEKVEVNKTVSESKPQSRELYVICKNLSEDEIELLRKPSPANMIKISEETENTNKIQAESSNENMRNSSISDLQPIQSAPEKPEINLKIEETKINNENENSDATLQTDKMVKEKIKPIKIRTKLRRNSKFVDYNEDKIDQTIEAVMNLTPEPEIKGKRGRPSKKGTVESKLVSNSETTITEIGTPVKEIETIIPQQIEMSDEDVPLVYRKSKFVSRRKYSPRSSNLKNRSIKSEDNSSLSPKNRKSVKNSKNDHFKPKTRRKPKAFRDKLEKFKHESRRTSDLKKKEAEKIESMKAEKKETDPFLLAEINIENKPKKYLRTYARPIKLKPPVLFPISDIYVSSVSTKTPEITTPKLKQKKSVRFSGNNSYYNYDSYYDDTNVSKLSENIFQKPKFEIRSTECTLQRAEQIKIKKYREIEGLESEFSKNSIDNQKVTSVDKSCIKKTSDIVPNLDTYGKKPVNLNIVELTGSNKHLSNTEPYREPMESTLNFTPKKLLSKKAREKLFQIQMKSVSEEKVNEKTEKEDLKNDVNIPESKEEPPNGNKSKFTISSLLNKENEVTDKHANNILPKAELKSSEDTSNLKNSTHQTSLKSVKVDSQSDEQDIEIKPKIQKWKSKFPKLKLNLNENSNLFLSKKLRKNIKSPKLKPQLRKKSAAQKSTKKRNEIVNNLDPVALSSVSQEINNKDENTNPVKNSEADIDKTSKLSSEGDKMNCANISKTIQPINALKNFVHNIGEQTESPKIGQTQNDVLSKSSDKINAKQFDYYSDQDDVSNSELIIDTSAESSDTDVEDKQNKSNKIQNRTRKYSHSIAEIVNLNDKTESAKKNSPVDVSTAQNINIFPSQVQDTNNAKESIKQSTPPKNKEFHGSAVSVIKQNIPNEIHIPVQNYKKVNTYDQVLEITSAPVVEKNINGKIQKSMLPNSKEIKTVPENEKVVSKQRTARITDVVLDVVEGVCEELNITPTSQEKTTTLVVPYGPSVEIGMNVEIGYESCTISQKKSLGEYAKEGCVKCSVNGKHKDNKRVAVRGEHEFELVKMDECLDQCTAIPQILYCQAVENIEPNLCNLIASIDSVEVSRNDSPVVDNYNLCILADIAMNSVHLNTKNENVVDVSTQYCNAMKPSEIPLEEGDGCFVVTFEDNLPESNEPTTNVFVTNNNSEPVSVEVTKYEESSPKQIHLENKLQTRNGTKINGENLDDLYQSLENICETQINTLKTPPKVDPVVHRIPEPITFDIPDPALIHLIPDDDDFIQNEPFTVRPLIEKSVVTSSEPKTDITIDPTAVKKLCNELDSIANDQNKNDTKKGIEEKPKTSKKRGRPSKIKPLDNQIDKTSSKQTESSHLLTKYKNNQDSNKQTDQQNNTNTSPPSYIRSTRPMRMVTTGKRKNNVLENKSNEEPPNKISASEKVFDKLLEEHKKELSETKIDKTESNDITTMPILDDLEDNIPLTVLQYNTSKNNEIGPSKHTENETEQTELVPSDKQVENVDKEEIKSVEETLVEVEHKSENELQPEDVTTEESDESINTCSTSQIEKDSEQGIEVCVLSEASDVTEKNASAIEVVQDWFNRVDNNNEEPEPCAEIEVTTCQNVPECNFFEEISSTHNTGKSDKKVFTEYQTPDSGIDKSPPENLSDNETTLSHSEISQAYFSSSDGSELVNLKDVNDTKVSIPLEKIENILSMLHLKSIPGGILLKRQCTIETTKGTKRNHESEEEEEEEELTEETCNIFVKGVKLQREYSSDGKIEKEFIVEDTKRRKYSIDDKVDQECIIEEILSPSPSPREFSSTLRTKGSVKEYPDCLFGITDSPVPSGSFHSPYPSDISLTEEPAFYEERGIDLCDDHPCYDSFEVFQKQQSLQREFNEVDDNPKDVQPGLQAGYCVVDSQFLPLSDGDYIFIDNKIFNDKRMVPVNMHQVQPETKPHNNEETKRSEFDDSDEKEDSLSETVDEIIKNPDIFAEQSTSGVQLVIACDTYQDLTDLFGITLQHDVPSAIKSETPKFMEIEDTVPENEAVSQSVDPIPSTSIEEAPIPSTSAAPISDIPEPEPMEILISDPIPESIKDNKKDSATNVKDTSTLNNDVNIIKEENNKKEKLDKFSISRLCISDAPSENHSKKPSNVSNSDISLTSPVKSTSQISPKLEYIKSKPAEDKNKNANKEEQKVPNPKIDRTMSAPVVTPPASKDQKKDHHDSKQKNIANDYKLKPLKTYDPVSPSSRKPDHKTYSRQNYSKPYDNSVSPSSQKTYPKENNAKQYYPKSHIDDSSYPSSQKSCPKQNTTKPYNSKTSFDSSNYSPSQKLDQKTYSKQKNTKPYNPKVPLDAFDRIKLGKCDITPPQSRTRHIPSDPYVRSRFRRDIPPPEYHRRHSSQSGNDSRRSQSVYSSEPSSRQAYRLPPSDPTYRSSQYNYRKPEVRPSQPKVDHRKQSASTSHQDWINERLLNLIENANTLEKKRNSERMENLFNMPYT